MKEKTLEIGSIASLINVFSSMDPEDQRVVLAYMEGMAAKSAQLSAGSGAAGRNRES